VSKQEKRQNQREKCYGKLYFLESGIPAYIRDISEDGLRVDCPTPLSPRDGSRAVFDVEFLPEGDVIFSPFKAVVEIRWIKEQEVFLSMGLRLVDIDAEAEEAYQGFLRAYKSHSSDEG
jgi:hypothetical protein